MSNEKTIRCTRCYEEFSDEETKNLSCCPKCGSKGVPMLIKHDVELRINWHELRILCIWAENWASDKCDGDTNASLDAIIRRITKVRPEGAPALTLTMEIQELQEEYPDTVLFKGNKMVVPPREKGEA